MNGRDASDPCANGSWKVDEEQLCAIAAQFTQQIVPPAVVHLSGELGAGKTTFVRAMLRSLGVQGAVKSPTYALIESYEVNLGMVVHLDLYRLEDPAELEFLGFRDLLEESALMLVEWPERGHDALPAADWQISIDYAAQRRQLSIISTPQEPAQLNSG